MKLAKCLHRLLIALGCLGTLFPRHCLAEANPAEQTSPITDVGLQAGGLLRGQLLDGAGTPRTATKVTVHWKSRPVAQATTNREGEFTVQGLRGGIHTVVTEHGTAACRFWAPDTAPPNVQTDLLVVDERTIVRGNNCKRHAIAHLLSDPLAMGLIVGTAVIVPIAIHAAREDNDDSGS